MAKKKGDIKDLLLEKGERIGMIVAVLVMLVLVVVGTVSALSEDSPGTTSQYIESKANSIEAKLSAGPVLNKPDFIEFPPLDAERVKLDPFKTKGDAFLDIGQEDGKKLNPKLLAVEEGKAEPARVQVKSHMFSVKGRDVYVYVLIPKDVKTPAAAPVDPRLQRWLDDYKRRFGDVPPQFKQQQGAGMPNAAGLVALGADGQPVREEYKIEPVPLDRIPPGARMAERVQPYRMAVVTAAFPYARQVEAYRQSRIFRSLEEAEKSPELLPQFLAYQVQRRAYDPQGKLKEDWKTLNYEQDYGPVVQYAVGAEPEDEALRPLIYQNMVLPRPQLTPRTSYPPVRLKAIDDAVAAIAARAGGGEEVKVLSPLEQKLRGGFNVFEANLPDERPAVRPPANEPNRRAKEFVVPRYCLVRFLDVTVQPGFTYEYQFQVRAKNPNEGKVDQVVYPDLASHKELVGPWGPDEPIKVTIDQEEFVYAAEIDPSVLRKEWPTLSTDRDVAFMQVHKWIERTRINPEQRNSEVPVGDWVIGDVPVRRGEFIGKMEQAEVPVWFETRERFDLAKPPPPPKVNNPLLRPPPPPKGIPVDFSTPDILVDFETGRLPQQLRTGDKTYRDVKAENDANTEMLVLSADGKLRVKNSKVDSRDKEREQRYAMWKKWIEEVRSNKAGGTPGKGGDFDPFKRPKN